MSKHFFLRLGASAQQPVQWQVHSGDGKVRRGEGSLEAAAQLWQGEPLSVLVPAEDVLELTMAVPTRQRKRLVQLVPYALEEQLIGAVEHQHFAIGEVSPDQRAAVAVVSHERMEDWRQQLAEYDLRPRRMVSEAAALPLREGEWSLLLEGERALLRSAAQRSYFIDRSNLPQLLPLLVSESETVPERLRVYGNGEAQEAPWSLWLPELEVVCESAANILDVMEAGAIDGAINLLQGPYSPREKAGRLWRPWRAAVAMLGAWLVLQGGMVFFDYQRLSSEDARLYDEMIALYQKTFPEARNVPDPVGQMRQKLEELTGGGGSDGFIGLMAAAGPVLGAIEGVELTALRFQDNSLDLELQLKDLPSLDTLKGELAAAGLAVDIRSANTQGERVESRVVITGGGA